MQRCTAVHHNNSWDCFSYGTRCWKWEGGENLIIPHKSIFAWFPSKYRWTGPRRVMKADEKHNKGRNTRQGDRPTRYNGPSQVPTLVWSASLSIIRDRSFSFSLRVSIFCRCFLTPRPGSRNKCLYNCTSSFVYRSVGERCFAWVGAIKLAISWYFCIERLFCIVKLWARVVL